MRFLNIIAFKAGVGALAFAALTAPMAQAADIVIGPGEWASAFAAGCSTLTVEANTMRYEADYKCNGSVDYVGEKVYLEGSTLHVDHATIKIRRQTESEFSGWWKLRRYQTQVTFVKK
ncbi:hypothetical protein [Pikeienuella sp. HZG-20]|uniref:hypothetical protein n=1 Tax=Paludibacillus litoralis TaxID=3133267 RepID=UPI0030EB269E